MLSPLPNVDNTLLEIGKLLNSQSSAIRFIAGTRIYEQGQPGDFAYMIDNGYVEISTNSSGQKHILAALGPGEIFGGVAVFDGLPRGATATAMHETTVIPISGKQLLDEVDSGSPIAKLLLIASMNRLRTLQANVHQDVVSRSVENGHQSGLCYAHIKLARDHAAKQLRLQYDMEKAIANQQFELVYQPIVSLADGRTAGFEALLRWPLPGGGVVTPDNFIPSAEQSGLIVPLGEWVLESALTALAVIERRLLQRQFKGAGIFMSLNVSPRQLEREEDVERLATLIEQAPVNPAYVKLEITEQALLLDPRMATISLARLKATGASIAIDDFGTGYSSLNYLHRFPLDTLKIDRSFVSRIVDDQGRQRVVSAIIGLAHELGMDVVAEGVEELDEAHWLHSHACRYAQGYLISKPASFATALGYLERDFEF